MASLHQLRGTGRTRGSGRPGDTGKSLCFDWAANSATMTELAVSGAACETPPDGQNVANHVKQENIIPKRNYICVS